MSSPQSFDVIVIGAGMAGLSVAAQLSGRVSVAVLERESQPGYHASGRSAALYSELYGNATVRALTRASRKFYFEPPAGFAANPLVSPRGTLYFAAHDEKETLDTFAASLQSTPPPVRLDAARTQRLVPVFKPGYLGGALYEEACADIDVAAALQGHAMVCKRQGAHIAFDSPVEALQSTNGSWLASTPRQSYRAGIVVNAAGAWGDQVAQLAGAAPLGLLPKRRTAVLIDPPDGSDARAWPAAVHVRETFYFKPDAGLLLLSPADETPSPPCDAQAEELDVAVAIDRFERASGTAVRRVRSRWAGLRSFVADKSPVAGFDPRRPGFFWLVGQGGYGIQMAPALARAACALALGEPLPSDLLDEGVDAAALAADRPGLGPCA